MIYDHLLQMGKDMITIRTQATQCEAEDRQDGNEVHLTDMKTTLPPDKYLSK